MHICECVCACITICRQVNNSEYPRELTMCFTDFLNLQYFWSAATFRLLESDCMVEGQEEVVVNV